MSLVIAMSRRAEDLRAARSSKEQFLQGMRKGLAMELKRTSITLNGRVVPLTEALPIRGHDVRHGSFARMRERPSLAEALEILVGACVVCIAILKPSRRSELHHLPRRCLVEGAEQPRRTDGRWRHGWTFDAQAGGWAAPGSTHGTS